jgi:hypothetical protein
MSIFDQVFCVVLAGLGWIVAPVMLTWGWVRWAKQPKPWTITSILALIGFLLASTSALVAVSSIMYANLIRSFPFYDPLLMKILGLGALLSLAGIIFAMGGIWRPNSLRWHSPVCAIGMLAFWLGVAVSQ